jgi:hypothetical protein
MSTQAEQSMKRSFGVTRMIGKVHAISNSFAPDEQVAGTESDYEMRIRILREHGLDPNKCSARQADEVLHDFIQ